MKKLAPQSKALSGENSLRVERIWKDFVVLGGKLKKKVCHASFKSRVTFGRVMMSSEANRRAETRFL